MSELLFCMGYGYTAARLAAVLRARGWMVHGTSRDPAKRQAMTVGGITAHAFERGRALDEAGRAALARSTAVLQSIIPGEAGDPVLDAHLGELRTASELRWLGWLGTTAVYGDRGGAWVDETDALNPDSPRAARRAEAEAAWLATGLPVHIFRLAGIYGPGRSALDELHAGTARRIVKPGQVFSRIHVDDIATVLAASLDQPAPGRIYNVCDDEPAAPQDVVAFAAELLGMAPPPEQPFETAELSVMARSFYGANRRVRNERIKQELGVRLAYPTYREGLRALREGLCPSSSPPGRGASWTSVI